MELASPDAEGFSFTACEDQLQRVQTAYEDVKESLLRAGAALRLPIPGMIDQLEQNSRVRHMARQMYKALQLLSRSHSVVEARIPGQEEISEQPEPVGEQEESSPGGDH
jgi:hypothetical protein